MTDIAALERVIREASDANLGTLELCEVYVALRDGLPQVATAIRARTGREPEVFLAGMRELLAPVS